MKAVIHRNYGASEEQALKEIAERGYHPLTFDVPATKNEPHFHDFDNALYMLEGELTVTETESGETYTLKPGDMADAKGFVLHHEDHQGFKAVFGFSQDPATFTMPIDKPAADLPKS